ncbi:MAG: diguanylate cyclase [Tepidisphaerales bacterium]
MPHEQPLGSDTCPLGGPMQKVAVVDDCPQVRKLIRARLKEEHVELLFAEGGAAGLELVRRTLPDLVLLDVDMPDVNGMEVIRQLKSDPATHHIPVIFLTGDSTPEAKVAGFDLGAVDYVTKPFEPAELRARVRASLRTKYLMDLLAQRAMLDGLTGLWNRAYFNDRLAKMVKLSQRHFGRPGSSDAAASGPESASRPDALGEPTGGGGMSLILFDVDHFKKLNDTHGHPFGDEVLRSVARTALARCRASDVVCRYGGEEFAVLCPETDGVGAGRLAEDLRLAVKSMELRHGGSAVQVTASFGVMQHDGRMSADELLSRTDAALYAAKRGGRDRVEMGSASDALPARTEGEKAGEQAAA